ncbi:hypothetical protein JKF63_00110 [Porcisia hertigi]|uniref:Uncharacterized protein n=1 Tax=Porcisia hertigi TaxID=2761500 RepID=A0A836HB22_9TRYP|nr:hypothetical protein JKF63_00110 [Porcisia hertigi]
MKSRRCHAAADEVVDPSPFDYTLLSHLYVHSDGTDVIDFGGLPPGKERQGRVDAFLKNRSFTPGTTRREPEAVGSYLHLCVGENEGAAVDDTEGCTVPSEQTSKPPCRMPAPVSNLVRIEDKAEHWWFFCQATEDSLPYARLLRGTDDFLRHLRAHKMELPRGLVAGSNPETAAEKLGEAQSHSRHRDTDNLNPTAALPLTKWLDIQVDRSNPASAKRVAELLALLPISQETKDHCLHLPTVDMIDVNSVTAAEDLHPASEYIFLNLMCTPVSDHDVSRSGVMNTTPATSKTTTPAPKASATRAKSKKSFWQLLKCENTDPSTRDRTKAKPVKLSRRTSAEHSSPGTYLRHRGVMEMRFDAARVGAPRTAVPEPVAVAVIVFKDWIFTIHEKPFAEMDDLLRMVQLHCSPPEVPTGALCHKALLHPTMQRRFTSTFAMSALLQIVVGHHLDSITLAQAVDQLGDHVFDVKKKRQDQDAVLHRITAVRRCFGQCGTDTARREVIFATLLQPMYLDRFFVADTAVRRELENAQAHLWQFQREISDCRDTVAASNWHHNVAIQWVLLRRGNRALRTALLLTEVTNIMYPIVTIQTLYSMNMRLPYEAESEPPHTTLVPFFVLAGVFLLYCVLCAGAIRRLLIRKSFETRLLA